MRTLTGAAALAGLLLGAAFAAAQESRNDSQSMLNDVLERVKERAEQQKVVDRQRALQLIEHARAAHEQGRMGDAIKILERARTLFPESPAVRQMLRELQGEQREAREQNTNYNVAKNRLEEAVDYIEQLVRERRFAQARELAEAVRDSATKFPQGVDVMKPLRAAERVLGELPALEAAPPRELLPPPDLPPPQPLKTPSEVRQMLAKRLELEWRDAPVAQVLQDLVTSTGVRIDVDPEVQASQVFLSHRVYLQSHGATAESILRSVTNVTGSTYILADGEVQILPRNRALAYTIYRSRQPPELGLRSVVVRPIRLADIPDFVNAAAEGAWSARPTRRALERPGQPAVSEPEYLKSGSALSAEIGRVLHPAKDSQEEP